MEQNHRSETSALKLFITGKIKLPFLFLFLIFSLFFYYRGLLVWHVVRDAINHFTKTFSFLKVLLPLQQSQKGPLSNDKPYWKLSNSHFLLYVNWLLFFDYFESDMIDFLITSLNPYLQVTSDEQQVNTSCSLTGIWSLPPMRRSGHSTNE